MLTWISISVIVLLALAVNAQYTFDDSVPMGRRFDGIGGLSGGGATSKLLPGYPEDLRNQILDYLFTPNFGAALHILKVEIGGGSMSGVGSEATHMYFDGDENYERGYEWWIMKEAKKRNPEIKLYGLPWVFSGYVDNGEGSNSPYTYPARSVDYIIRWIQGAQNVHNLTIDYIGEWNEQNYNITYLKLLRKSLDTAGLDHVRIVAADDYQVDLSMNLQRDLFLDPDFSGVIDIFGIHYSSTQSNLGEILWGKQLWASEDYSTLNDMQGARCWARILNQNYVNGLMSSTISWNLIAAYYEGMPYPGCGLMTANNPWGGYYSVDPTIWMSAHTCQFTKPGWTYLSHKAGVGHLVGGGSYVSLTSPDKKELTIIMETIEFQDSQCLHESLPAYSTVAQTVSFKLMGSFKDIPMFHVWFSDLSETNATVLFKRVGELKPEGGIFNLYMEPNQVYTLTTVATGSKGQHPDPPPHKDFPIPYTDTFDKYPDHQEPFYIAPMAGSFEVVPTGGEPGKKHLRQMTVLKPVDWCETENFTLAILGNISWVDIEVSVEVAIDTRDPKAAEGVHVATRINSGGCYTAGGGGIFFYVFPVIGSWQVWNDARRATLLAYGPQTSFNTTASAWNTMSLTLLPNGFAEGRINYKFIFGIKIPDKPASGFAAFGTAGFGHAEFKSVTVR